ncbi:MAG: DUF2502 domain-containing protein [Betaproteobacteria bacterium]|nr:DUF2502 domain-containing protein [Betaproteobacteria bacterium]
MKKLIVAGLVAATPLFAQAADVNINIGSASVQTPGATVVFGSRDNRGYYWDGGDWRNRDYWERHHGPRGEKYYTGRRHQDAPHRDKHKHEHKRGFCPPGQAKKGNC